MRARQFIHREAAHGLHVPSSHGFTRITPFSIDAPKPGLSPAGILGDVPTSASSFAAPEPAPEPWAPPAGFWDALGAGVLDDRARKILLLRWRDGLTLRATAVKVGVSRERIRQIETAALEKLRDDPNLYRLMEELE